MVILLHTYILVTLLIYSLQNKLSTADGMIRIFRFTKKTSSIQTFVNRGMGGKPPFSTNSTSVLACVADLLTFGPFPCMEYYSQQQTCRSSNGGETASSLNDKMDIGWSLYNMVSSIDYFPTECKLSANGREYRGRANVTVNGIQCQHWNASGPQVVPLTIQDGLLQTEGPGILTTNFCRNPDNTKGGPWCYTMDPNARWDFCDVPKCQCYT